MLKSMLMNPHKNNSNSHSYLSARLRGGALGYPVLPKTPFPTSVLPSQAACAQPPNKPTSPVGWPLLPNAKCPTVLQGHIGMDEDSSTHSARTSTISSECICKAEVLFPFYTDMVLYKGCPSTWVETLIEKLLGLILFSWRLYRYKPSFKTEFE